MKRPRLRALAGLAFLLLLPAAGFAVTRAVEGPGPAGAFRAGLVGLVLVVALGAFAARSRGEALCLLAAIILLAAAVAGTGARLEAALDAAGLALAVAAAASGLSAVGRAIRAPAFPAAAVAAIVLWTAMGGLYWADPLAEHLPRSERRAFRQAVLHVDPALAYAYDAAGHDHLRSEAVYFSVPLASSLFERPHARTTAALWLTVGALAWGLAGCLAWARGGKGGRRRSTVGGT